MTLTQSEQEMASEIAKFAKRINYNIEDGVTELVRLWVLDGQKFIKFVEDNKEDFIRTTKQFLKN